MGLCTIFRVTSGNVVELAHRRVARAIQNSRNCIWRWVSPGACNLPIAWIRPGIRPGKPIEKTWTHCSRNHRCLHVDGFANTTDEEAGTGRRNRGARGVPPAVLTFAAVLQHRAKPTCCDPENTVDKVHAVCLRADRPLASRLQAASLELESCGIGLSVGPTQVPILCSSCIRPCLWRPHCGTPRHRGRHRRRAQTLDHTPTALEQGNVGAGTGATVGKLMGLPPP